MDGCTGIDEERQRARKEKFISNSIRFGVLGLVSLALSSALGLFGSRGFITEHQFPYRGRNALIIRDDRRFSFDEYFMKIDNDKIIFGELRDDLGNIINISTGGYSIKKAEGERRLEE